MHDLRFCSMCQTVVCRNCICGVTLDDSGEPLADPEPLRRTCFPYKAFTNTINYQFDKVNLLEKSNDKIVAARYALVATRTLCVSVTVVLSMHMVNFAKACLSLQAVSLSVLCGSLRSSSLLEKQGRTS